MALVTYIKGALRNVTLREGKKVEKGTELLI
jgi:hypothetical protein